MLTYTYDSAPAVCSLYHTPPLFAYFFTAAAFIIEIISDVPWHAKVSSMNIIRYFTQSCQIVGSVGDAASKYNVLTPLYAEQNKVRSPDERPQANTLLKVEVYRMLADAVSASEQQQRKVKFMLQMLWCSFTDIQCCCHTAFRFRSS